MPISRKVNNHLFELLKSVKVTILVLSLGLLSQKKDENCFSVIRRKLLYHDCGG